MIKVPCPPSRQVQCSIALFFSNHPHSCLPRTVNHSHSKHLMVRKKRTQMAQGSLDPAAAAFVPGRGQQRPPSNSTSNSLTMRSRTLSGSSAEEIVFKGRQRSSGEDGTRSRIPIIDAGGINQRPLANVGGLQAQAPLKSPSSSRTEGGFSDLSLPQGPPPSTVKYNVPQRRSPLERVPVEGISSRSTWKPINHDPSW